MQQAKTTARIGVMTEYVYQTRLKRDVLEKFATGATRIVLAACPGAGKTRMAVELADSLLKSGKAKKILILTHGQTNLRSQFVKEGILRTGKTPFSFVELGSKRDPEVAAVHVGLPHYFTAKRLASLGDLPYDLVIVDEAHHFYDSPSEQRIFAACPKAKHLLLTGSPSKFIGREGFELVGISALELIDSGELTDSSVELFAIDDDVDLGDYDSDGELPKTKSVKGVRAAVRAILAVLKPTKTLILAHNQKQAWAILKSCVGRTAKISTCDTDEGSKLIEEFKNDPWLQILIVVRRGGLGFNYPQLCNVVDFSFSLNPDVVFQFMGRVMRSYKGAEKRFIKVAPQNLRWAHEHVLRFALALGCAEDFFSYTGNWKELPISVPREVKARLEKASKDSREGIQSPRLNWVPFRETMRGAYDLRSGSALRVAKATFDGDVRAALGVRRILCLELVHQSARCHGRVVDWQRADPSGYKWAREKGKTVLDICTAHMSRSVRARYSDDELRASAQLYSHRGAWLSEDVRTYQVAKKRGDIFFESCCQHMAKSQSAALTETAIRESAGTHSKRGRWKLADPSAYNAARKRGDEFFRFVTAHMDAPIHNGGRHGD